MLVYDPPPPPRALGFGIAQKFSCLQGFIALYSSYSSGISTFSKNKTQTVVTNVMKQRMLQKTKILKTRFKYAGNYNSLYKHQ